MAKVAKKEEEKVDEGVDQAVLGGKEAKSVLLAHFTKILNCLECKQKPAHILHRENEYEIIKSFMNA